MFLTSKQDASVVTVCVGVLMLTALVMTGCQPEGDDRYRRVMVEVVQYDPEAIEETYRSVKPIGGRNYRIKAQRYTPGTMVEVIQDPYGIVESETVTPSETVLGGDVYSTVLTKNSGNREGFRYWVPGQWGEAGDILFMFMKPDAYGSYKLKAN